MGKALCRRIRNDYSFPAACTVRMRFAPKGERAALDIYWYDGGIKPPVPEELMAEARELAEEGMMFVGDQGKILGGFRSEMAARFIASEIGPASVKSP